MINVSLKHGFTLFSNLHSREEKKEKSKKGSMEFKPETTERVQNILRDIKTYLTESLVDFTMLQKQQKKTRQSQESHQPTHNWF